MNKKSWHKLPVLLGLLSFLITGCAHVISYEVRQKARSDLPFTTVLNNPEAFKGETVVWGGRIIETLNKEEETSLKILQIPLDYYGMPQGEDRSEGRFVVKMRGYVDKEVYRPGRLMTVAGEVVGSEIEPVGEAQYTYPVLHVKEVHLWRRYPYYYPPYEPPYWHWYGYDYPYPFHWPHFGYHFFLFP